MCLGRGIGAAQQDKPRSRALRPVASIDSEEEEEEASDEDSADDESDDDEGVVPPSAGVTLAVPCVPAYTAIKSYSTCAFNSWTIPCKSCNPSGNRIWAILQTPFRLEIDSTINSNSITGPEFHFLQECDATSAPGALVHP